MALLTALAAAAVREGCAGILVVGASVCPRVAVGGSAAIGCDTVVTVSHEVRRVTVRGTSSAS